MKALRVWQVFVLLLAACVLITPAAQAVAQTRPGINAQITAPEGCSISDPVDTENMFTFTMAQIHALSFAREGERASLQTRPAGGGSQSSLVPNFVGLRQERIDTTCAGFLLTPYTNSKIESMATVAKYLVFAYQELSKMSDEMLGINLRSAYPSSTGPSERIELAKWSGKRQEILNNMTDALNVSLSLLIRPGGEGQPGILILTPEERRSLLDYLDSQFPATAGQGATGRAGDFAKQAALIRSFLRNGYKLAAGGSTKNDLPR